MYRYRYIKTFIYPYFCVEPNTIKYINVIFNDFLEEINVKGLKYGAMFKYSTFDPIFC